MPLNIVAALAVKQIMERDKLPGTLMLWPGVAEELLASKAWFVREGVFKDVDVCLFAHVGEQPGRVVGRAPAATGLVSVRVHVLRARPRTAPARPGAAAARSTPWS